MRLEMARANSIHPHCPSTPGPCSKLPASPCASSFGEPTRPKFTNELQYEKMIKFTRIIREILRLTLYEKDHLHVGRFGCSSPC